MKNLNLELASIQAFHNADFTIWPDVKREAPLTHFPLFSAVAAENKDKGLLTRITVPVLCIDQPFSLIKTPTRHLTATAQKAQQFLSRAAREQLPDIIPETLLPHEEHPAYKAEPEKDGTLLDVLTALGTYATELTKDEGRIFVFPLIVAPQLNLIEADGKTSSIDYGLVMSRRHAVVGHAALRFTTLAGLPALVKRLAELRQSIAAQTEKGEA